MPRSGNLQPAIDNAEHIGPNDTGDNIEAKRTAGYVWNGTTWERQSNIGSSGANPINVTGTVTATGAQLDIEDALSLSSYNLQSAAYSTATSITTDYLLSALLLKFSTAESKTITLTSSDGALLYTSGATTAQNFNVPLGQYINENENVTLAITQTAGACTVSGKLTIAQGSVALGGTAIVNIRGDGGIFGANTDTDNAVTPDGELMVSETERERNVIVSYKITSVSVTTYYCLVDLSNTTTWPHDSTGRIDVSGYRVEMDRNTFNGSVAVGVVTAISGSNCTVTYFREWLVDSSTGGIYSHHEIDTPNQTKLNQSDGILTRYFSNNAETTTSVTTASTLASPSGSTVTPAVGDILLRISRTSGTLSQLNFKLFYHSESS